MFWQLRRDDILASNSFRFRQSKAEIAIFFYGKIFQQIFRQLRGQKHIILIFYAKIFQTNLQAIEGAEPEDLIGQVHVKREDAVQRLGNILTINFQHIIIF